MTILPIFDYTAQQADTRMERQMKDRYPVIMCALLITLLTGVFYSAVAEAAEGLTPYPQAEAEMSKSQPQYKHLMATGRIQNKGGQSFPESWLDLTEGDLTETLYRIQSTRDTADILQHYKAQLQQPSRQILFECSSRECGSSSDWANRVFKVSTLYGVDRKQHYIVGRKDEGGWSDYVAVYITERGTGRIYAFVQHYRVKTAALDKKGVRDSLFDQLTLNGWVRLPVTADGQFEEGARARLQALVTKLQATSERYWLVAHHFGKDSQQALQLRSEKAAARLLDALTGLGLPADKVTTKGLGALAPTKDSIAYGGRIELLIQK